VFIVPVCILISVVFLFPHPDVSYFKMLFLLINYYIIFYCLQDRHLLYETVFESIKYTGKNTTDCISHAKSLTGGKLATATIQRTVVFSCIKQHVSISACEKLARILHSLPKNQCNLLGGRLGGRCCVHAGVPPPPLPACRHVDMPATPLAAGPIAGDAVGRRR
jgi:hypothetical protein